MRMCCAMSSDEDEAHGQKCVSGASNILQGSEADVMTALRIAGGPPWAPAEARFSRRHSRRGLQALAFAMNR